MTECVVRGERVLIDGALRPAAIHIRDGRIARIGTPRDLGAGIDVHDAGDAVVMPGLVDTHVHVNEPGRAEWEGFDTATRAAAAGGITTILDMPLNSIPSTTTGEALREKRDVATGRVHVDVGFIGGVVPGSTREIDVLARAGVLAFKCFLIDSGVAEFARVTRDDLSRALPRLAALGRVLMVHAELPGPIERAIAGLGPSADPRRYETWLALRPPAAEVEAIELLADLARTTGARVHVVHVSSREAADAVRSARESGAALTAESCPHYLVLAAESIPDGATQYKCAPPIRDRSHRDALWAALRSGDLDMIVTDHSPCPPSLKLPDEGDCVRAWGGIASLQLSLPAVWSCAPAHGATIADVARWMCERPAALAGISGRKGTIAPDCDADLVIWDPDAEFVVDQSTLHHRHKLTPYHGMRLRGRVLETWLRGERVYDRGDFPRRASGHLLSAA